MTELIFTPINAAACSLNDTARIAMPTRVLCTIKVSATSSSAVVVKTRI
jgi:hypothetical protein